jgi:hypothetical protein
LATNLADAWPRAPRARVRASFFPHRSLHPSNVSPELPLGLEPRDLHGASGIRTGLGDEALDFTIA